MSFKSFLHPVKAFVFLLALSSFFVSNASAVTVLPDPNLTFDGLPISRQYDQFISYSTKLLTQFGYAGFSGPSGVGGLDVVLLTQAGGIDNTPVSGGFNFEDPAPSTSGGCPSCDHFSGTWGAGDQPNGPVTVDNLLGYLHNQFGAANNIPVFTFDLVEPGAAATRDLDLAAKFSVYDPVNHVDVATWSLDGMNNGSFDAASFITVEGSLSLTGLSSTVYTADNTGSGKYDYLVYAPTMNLAPYAGLGYEFHIFSEFKNLNGGGEESFISGAFTTPPTTTAVPEPASFVLVGLGLLGFLKRPTQVRVLQ